MKLFLRSPEESLLLKDAVKRSRVDIGRIKREMKKLEKIGFLKAKQISPRKQLFSVNPNFDFFNELRELILKSAPISKERLVRSVRKLGKIKLILLSGIFTGNDAARADLLVVGDNINQKKFGSLIRDLEAEAGTEINCLVLNVEEFTYRYSMYDRFVRDLLNEKSEILVNKLKIGGF
jgi:hypothetical protein